MSARKARTAGNASRWVAMNIGSLGAKLPKSGLPERVNLTKSSGVRTKKRGSVSATMSVLEPSGR